MTFRQARRYALAAALPLALATNAWAQGLAAGESAVPELPVVVISGSKYGQRLDRLNGAASVAERMDLDDSQITNTMELDRVFPELQMGYSSSLLFPTITLRGMTSAQDFYNPALTVYVDGVPQLPVASLQSLVDVERVELLKGPQGTLYGKSALGGVLNVVTRQPDDHWQTTVRAGIANHGSHQAQANVSGPLARDLLYGSVSLSSHKLGGTLHSPVIPGDLGGMRSDVGKVKLRLAPTGSPWEFGLSGGRDCTEAKQDVYVDYDDPRSNTVISASPGLPDDKRRTHQRRCVNAMAAHGQYAWQDWQLKALLSNQNLDLERDFPYGAYPIEHTEQWRQNTQELRLSTHANAAVPRQWDGVFGLYRQALHQSGHFLTDSKNPSESLAAYGDATWHVTPAADLSGGLRFSHDTANIDLSGMSRTGDSFAGDGALAQNTWLGRLGAGYQLSAQWRAYANVAQGYKPAGYNLAPSSIIDAQNFKQEFATSYETGVRYGSPQLRLGLAAYQIKSHDVQLYVGTTPGSQNLKNAGDSRSTGFEFNADWDVTRNWTLAASGFVNQATFTSYRDANCTHCTGNRVPLTPRNGFALSAKGRQQLAGMVLHPRLSARYVGNHYFDPENNLAQEGYAVLDAGLAWLPTSNLEVALYANNLTDRAYRTYGFGNMAQIGPRRSFGLTVNYAY